MESDDENSDVKINKEQIDSHSKEIVSLDSTKLIERTNNLIKKLKFKSKSLGSTSISSDIKSVTKLSVSNCPADKRQHLNGDENPILTKSASETNLQENWKDKSLSHVDTDFKVKKIIAIESNQLDVSLEQKDFQERTKSLENFKDMPAYGELIMDQSSTARSNANQFSKPKDHLYKILVIGDLGTGKTSIIKRYVHRFFTQHYRATIGVDFALKVLNWDDYTLIRLQLWDIAGQERYGNMTRVYYKEAVGAFIVFDVTRRNTFESVEKWKSDLDSKVQLPDGSPIPCILLANKCDQQKEGIVTSPSKMEEYCRENRFTAWFETSARDNINIDEAARALVEKILACDSLQNNDVKKGTDQFSLTQDANERNSNGKCSC